MIVLRLDMPPDPRWDRADGASPPALVRTTNRPRPNRQHSPVRRGDRERKSPGSALGGAPHAFGVAIARVGARGPALPRARRDRLSPALLSREARPALAGTAQPGGATSPR